MPKFVPLDFSQHKLLRVANRYGAPLGDAVGMVSVVPTEIPALVNDYPLFFRLTPAGDRYELGAVLGFEADENLFLDEQRWDAPYVPLAIRCQPFAVQQSATSPEHNSLMIDIESERLVQSGGDVIFFSDGRPSERLQAVVDGLESLVRGAEIGRAYVAALTALELIEPVEVRVDLGQGQSKTLAGLYTIASERLRALSASELFDLKEKGFLPWIYQQAASAGQINNLIMRKSRLKA